MWQRYTEVIAKLSLWIRNLSLYLREWHGHWLCHLPPVSPRGEATHLFEDGVIMAPDSAMGVTVVGKGEMPEGGRLPPAPGTEVSLLRFTKGRHVEDCDGGGGGGMYAEPRGGGTVPTGVRSPLCSTFAAVQSTSSHAAASQCVPGRWCRWDKVLGLPKVTRFYDSMCPLRHARAFSVAVARAPSGRPGRLPKPMQPLP